jgi:hypothetical protein
MSKIKAVIVFVTLFGAGLSPVAAQEGRTDVAFVEAVSGRVVAFAAGKPVLLDALDVVSDRTRLDLQANSELRLCHYQTRRFVTVKGPARVTASADGLIVEVGKAAEVSQETCSGAKISTFQGGFVARGVPNKK